MASYLVDTNVLLRAAEPQSARHGIAGAALERLLRGSEQCFVAPQVIVEFWAVVTRARAANGLGWRNQQTKQAVDRLLQQFPILDENPRVFTTWLDLVLSHSIAGKRVHDARLVAIMHVHQVTHLLTFNIADFPAHLGVVAVSPDELT